MKTTRLLITLAIASAALCSCSEKYGESVSATSPDGNIKLNFALSAKGVPTYSLEYGDRQVIAPSKLGFTFRGKRIRGRRTMENKAKRYGKPVDMQTGFSLQDVKRSSFDETWTTVWGEESHIRNHYNELAVTLDHDGVHMIVRFRVYDDGLGFRYEFPEQPNLVDFVISEELTEFAMTGDHTAYWIPGDYDTQEYSYNICRLSEIPSVADKMTERNASHQLFSSTGVQTALQLKTDDGLYINIHEAAVENYPTTNLDLDERSKTFRTHLTPDAEGWGALLQAASHTPWRTVMVVDDARKVLSSRLILNLNEPCALEDVSWIHPTKYMGVWWEMIVGGSTWSYTDDHNVIVVGETDYENSTPHNRHGANNENVRRYIDFAAENGFDAILVEGWNVGWENWYGHQKERVFDFVTPYPDFDLPALNAYAHSKGIRLIMHHETSSSTVNYERWLPEAFELMNEYGYDAVKTGYVGDILPIGEHHYSQSIINHYNYVIHRAAQHHI
ncbi:MAG: glycoside hydrolase family 97 N-terminal domain-containing protein, partial [Bacteroidales bacterium]|nr:glycoside hydrolase family 97 N-terminal domain-containing protein [Bacteroidales bacterium]